MNFTPKQTLYFKTDIPIRNLKTLLPPHVTAQIAFHESLRCADDSYFYRVDYIEEQIYKDSDGFLHDFILAVGNMIHVLEL